MRAGLEDPLDDALSELIHRSTVREVPLKVVVQMHLKRLARHRVHNGSKPLGQFGPHGAGIRSGAQPRLKVSSVVAPLADAEHAR